MSYDYGYYMAIAHKVHNFLRGPLSGLELSLSKKTTNLRATAPMPPTPFEGTPISRAKWPSRASAA